MSDSERTDTFAAVDLGSNSFHLLVARREHGELRVIDRIKEMVRLGGGLDAEGNLDRVIQDRAFACLARFGQRLRGIPADNLRAVGTQTFRRMKNANSFLMIAETGLGCSIDIIAGREEARLIYLGVTQGVSGHQDRRLVIDIGGGSTELVIGEGLEPLEMESLQYGCVSLTRQFFGDGRISIDRWKKAVRSVMADLQELRVRYLRAGWDSVIGSSGTIKAVEEICRQQGWIEKDINADALHMLRDRLLEFETIDSVRLAGLSERRHPVLAGGLVMLCACFEALEIESIRVSPYALREGVLHDLLGRLDNQDPRAKTIDAFMSRYSVDRNQVNRVKELALRTCDKLSDGMHLQPIHRQLLGWAADLHETGLGISHSQYQLHSGYLVENSDMTGFTHQEQLFLAALVRNHRRPIPRSFTDQLPTRLHEPLRMTLFCLRFACILCRSREDLAIPSFRLSGSDNRITVSFPAHWSENHPLTLFDLQQESRDLQSIGLQFRISKPLTSV
ncbi:MAG: Ppx/GppA family phosphatase [Xanthomonadales bacterium]|jgi:exopolyphosphatase/guanosine-5'-triphosphate,3'-diphosphate pyrophosphatase|nr:Ppx/GppA family phosphatase [Xanthomonadales bacterium]MDH3941933.1 Ppx/GppA family phosphatase [Xanthomonadales bacterium]MDH4000729.1 Ppx/GppA family phosphatase [Xanthomonadales bacterium]